MKISAVAKTLSGAVLCATVFLWSGAGAFATAEAPIDSLFFTPAETKQIDAMVGLNAKNDPKHPDIHLGAVMYYGPDDWTLWLQGERWTPATDRSDLHILGVTPDEVRLSVMDSPETTAHEITLRPHQTYQVVTGKVIEGSSE